MGFSKWLKKSIILLILFIGIDFGISQLLLTGVNKYFGLHSKSQIFINGSSMAMAGFDKTNLEHSLHKSIAFYTRTGVSLQDRNAMLHHYFDNSGKETDIAIFEVNPMLFSKKFTAENVYLLFLPFIDEPSMGAFIRSKTDAKEFWIRKVIRCSRYNNDMIALSIKGYMHNYENQKHVVLDNTALSGLKSEANSVSVELDPEKIRLFRESIALMKLHSKKVILVNMPVFSTKQETFQADGYAAYLKTIQQAANANDGIYFLELNNTDLIKNPNYFSDPLHLNADGQAQVTGLLTKFINENGI